MYVQTPPPPPPESTAGHHLHDGFYLRLSLGANGQRSTVESDRANVSDLKVTGGGLSFDILVGGTPTPGLVIGGILAADAASKPTVKQDGVESNDDFDSALALIGPFIDGFFDPEGGFHVGGALGLTAYAFDNRSITEDNNKNFGGGGASVWVGYDAWVSSQWSIGGMLRLTGASGTRDLVDASNVTETQKATSGSFALLFTALYH
jgi:hypothetical protein